MKGLGAAVSVEEQKRIPGGGTSPLHRARRWWLWLILTLAVAAAVVLWMRGATPTVEYKSMKVERGAITATVSATGKVNAVVTVQVGSQVSGT
ncbi:MAG TPA: hypothetical protein VEI24_05605, partial [Nitrospiria bacterium]|nr:hypothetical protein [Nitrospiria bacterium]